jgi:hypothetical protein
MPFNRLDCSNPLLEDVGKEENGDSISGIQGISKKNMVLIQKNPLLKSEAPAPVNPKQTAAGGFASMDGDAP